MKVRNQKRRQTDGKKSVSLKNIQHMFFRTQLILIISLAVILGGAGILINIHYETEKRDQNLQNVAETIARSPILMDGGFASEESVSVISERLDTLK